MLTSSGLSDPRLPDSVFRTFGLPDFPTSRLSKTLNDPTNQPTQLTQLTQPINQHRTSRPSYFLFIIANSSSLYVAPIGMSLPAILI